jgi:sugar O-acyltransferase (sialic acid O-acetyltransferase NeuD family)
MHFYLTQDSPHEVVAFTVDAAYVREPSFDGLPVVPFEEVERSYPPTDFQMSIPISYRLVNHLRAEKYGDAKAKGYGVITYVSSKAMVSPGAVVGEGGIVTEGCIVQPFAQLGRNVVMSCGSVVAHHSVVGDHCFLGPGSLTLGDSRVGPYSFLGANSTIGDCVTVGPECIVGAGVTITRDTNARQVFVGSRPRALSKTSDELREWLTWRT